MEESYQRDDKDGWYYPGRKYGVEIIFFEKAGKDNCINIENVLPRPARCAHRPRSLDFSTVHLSGNCIPLHKVPTVPSSSTYKSTDLGEVFLLNDGGLSTSKTQTLVFDQLVDAIDEDSLFQSCFLPRDPGGPPVQTADSPSARNLALFLTLVLTKQEGHAPWIDLPFSYSPRYSYRKE